MKSLFLTIVILFLFFSKYSFSQNILEETLIYRGNLAFDQETDEPINGTVISNFESGQIKEKGSYVDGLRENEWKEFYENGSVKSTINYKNGFKHGPFELFFENGKLKGLGNYSNGNEQGNWQEFSNEGNFLYIGNYEDGFLEGRWP